jgi:hypothetical protein
MTLHWVPAASEVPQLLLCEKLLLAVILLMLAAVVPVFFTVTVCDELVVPTVWLPNVRLVGDKVNAVDAAIVIDSCFVAVDPVASVTSTVNVLVPALAGVPDTTPAVVNVMPLLHEPLQAGTFQV